MFLASRSPPRSGERGSQQPDKPDAVREAGENFLRGNLQKVPDVQIMGKVSSKKKHTPRPRVGQGQ